MIHATLGMDEDSRVFQTKDWQTLKLHFPAVSYCLEHLRLSHCGKLSANLLDATCSAFPAQGKALWPKYMLERQQDGSEIV